VGLAEHVTEAGRNAAAAQGRANHSLPVLRGVTARPHATSSINYRSPEQIGDE